MIFVDKREISTLRLFKTVVSSVNLEGKPNEKALRYGIVIDNALDEDIVDEAINQYGVDILGVNSTLHKSFKKVKNASYGQLVLEQICHYFSTYGTNFEGEVYIPSEETDIEALSFVKFVKIDVVSSYDDLFDKTINLLDGTALSEDTVSDLVTITKTFSREHIIEIVNNSKNREVNVRLCATFNVVPRNGDEFIRYLIYSATGGKTLKIKSKDVLDALKCSYFDYAQIFEKYEQTYGSFIPLAESFNRNKEFYVAIKHSIFSVPTIVNKISKLSKKHHVPVPNKNSIKNIIDIDSLDLSKVKFNDLVKAYNASLYNLHNYKYIGYTIRNGKKFYKESKLDNYNICRYTKNSNILMREIKKRVADNDAIYIPNGVNYSVPFSEKQFVGNFPNYTSVELPSDKSLLIGVHWTSHVDIDFAMRNAITGESVSWNSTYRNSNKTILFSGDMTDTVGGHASEVFYFDDPKSAEGFMAELNVYSGESDLTCDFFIAVSDKKTTLERNYMVDPNDIIVMVKNIELKNRALHIGDFVVKDGKLVFVLNAETKKNTAISTLNEVSKMAQYVADKKANTVLTFRDLFTIIDDEMVQKFKEAELNYIDLSPNVLTKDTLLNILK